MLPVQLVTRPHLLEKIPYLQNGVRSLSTYHIGYNDLHTKL